MEIEKSVAWRKLVFISDTHGNHHNMDIPDGDILVHCGDCTRDATTGSLMVFLRWFQSHPHPHKIMIAGNHDLIFERTPDLAKKLVGEIAPSVTYLQDSGCEILGLKFWGSPYTPEFCNWAFNLPRGEELKRHWDMIPEETDVLISHGPPKGFLDWNHNDRLHCGCEDLLNAVIRIKPRIHAFGHIHSGYGVVGLEDGITLVNASCSNEAYKSVNKPIKCFL